MRKVGGRMRIPAEFLRYAEDTRTAPESLQLYFRLIIQPDGSVGGSSLLPPPEDKPFVYPPLLLEAFAKDAQRVIRTLRFTPATRQDTLTLPMSYRIY